MIPHPLPVSMKKRYAAWLLAMHAGKAVAQAAPHKSLLDYPLRDLLFLCAMITLGGIASWYNKVRRGELAATNMFALFGEAAVSALAGLLFGLLADAMGASFSIVVAAAGLGGHAGARALTALEVVARRAAEKKLGIDPTKPAPLDESK